MHYKKSPAIFLFLLGLLTSPLPAWSQNPATVGSLPAGTAPPAGAKAIDTELIRATGLLALSVDGTGSSAASYTIDVAKPNIQTSVRQAFFLAAARGNSNIQIANGAITLNGTPVNWDGTVASQILSFNYYADVTTIVKPVVDVAAAGRIGFTVDESAVPSRDVDGTALAVVFDDPLQPQTTTIVFLFGTQNTNGDRFTITLAAPINPAGAGVVADMGLGISFGSQELNATGTQFSTIDVNGVRLTSSAGGEDDGEAATNGALFTIGGLDDSNANPVNPNAIPPSPPNPVGTSRIDDELYSLLPLITNTTTTIAVDTVNPSRDDNIFFAYFRLSGTAFISQGISLTPVSATLVVNTSHTVTATVTNSLGNPVAGSTVTFNVTTGPNAGNTAQVITNASGQATFSYTGSNGVGTDTIGASVDNNGNITQATAVTVSWVTVAESITLSPAAATRVVNTDHNVTALVSNTLGNPVAGVTVNFVISSGPNATVGSPPLAVVTDANGMAVFSYTGSNGTGADSIAASFNSGATVVTATPVSVTWITVPAAITLSPDAVTLVVGNNHTVTAQVTDTLGAPAANVTVGFNVNSGPNAGISAQAVTDAGGRATFTYTGINGPGTDTIGASLVAGNTTVTAMPVTVIWELAAAIVIPTLAPLALVLMLAMLGMAGALVLRRKA